MGCDQAANPEKLLELFEAKFSHAIKATAKLMDFSELYCDRQGFRKHIIAAIGQDLNGYVLEDVALESLEQTPLEYLDHNNTLDAEGIRKITMITSQEQEIANERIREKDIRIKEQDVGAQIRFRQLEREMERKKREL